MNAAHSEGSEDKVNYYLSKRIMLVIILTTNGSNKLLDRATVLRHFHDRRIAEDQETFLQCIHR